MVKHPTGIPSNLQFNSSMGIDPNHWTPHVGFCRAQTGSNSKDAPFWVSGYQKGESHLGVAFLCFGGPSQGGFGSFSWLLFQPAQGPLEKGQTPFIWPCSY